MKFFKHESKKSVLFVCVQNAGRSQMAEGFFKKYAPKEYEGISAGTMPVSEINPLAVEVMREVNIDISGQKSKEITEDMIRNSSKIVNMGCMDKVSCPTLFLQNLLDWNIEDPKDKQIEKVREIRDEIEQRVKKLVADIKNYQ
ncbi:MAG: arsenate reductase ArsC [Nitrosopumilales archaeon]|nr:MAG: arsenate reductase ArsC [Nitrosopumilales archaeon]